MGFRFRKSFAIIPGLVRINLGKTLSPSITVGKRGLTLTAGKRGVYGNAGIPGSGLSYRTRLDKPTPRRRQKPDTAGESFTGTESTSNGLGKYVIILVLIGFILGVVLF